MDARGSRTYKLCLSDAGFDHLLDCHRRVGLVARSLLPFGATVFVGLTIADDLAPTVLAAMLDAPACQSLVGREVRFVGFTGHLADITERLRERVLLEAASRKAPKINRLYAAGLSCLGSASEEAIGGAYRRLRAIRPA
ncbi:hypothetical protein QLH51_12975 [Sphingomonas sp. 2R-10]|uniref:hypothetical protein n=1 Tax=Sphingomonas sp. 2R-10 TaxID=3045148 RepID=UPI000F76F04D|nr:hypothetical protein [Sphingomonas sp. 2R-10]MDJ0277711.1 hypothetical protein [Sphingomonas sp. 2R-10]